MDKMKIKKGDYEYSRWDYENFWNVKVLDTTKTEYGPIEKEIDGMPVTNMKWTFSKCTSLETAPVIPNSVTDMNGTFVGCTKLTTAPTIPNSVTSMKWTFCGCTSLVDASNIIIPNSVTSMDSTFNGCTSLKTAPVIPNSVTSIFGSFSNCTSLTTAPAIPSSVEDMGWAFNGCTSLETAPAIPNSVTDMNGIFCGCSKLNQKLFNYVKSGIEDGTILPFEVEQPNGECAICAVIPECILLCFRNFADVVVRPISSSEFAMDKQFDKYTPTNASVEDTLKEALELFSSNKSPIEIMNMVAERSKTATLVENGSLDEKLKKLDASIQDSNINNNTLAYDDKNER